MPIAALPAASLTDNQMWVVAIPFRLTAIAARDRSSDPWLTHFRRATSRRARVLIELLTGRDKDAVGRLQSPQSHSSSIDGLRSVAVLPVLIGHAFPSVLPGGFVGVDIFFVISGFLIASMIADKSLRDLFSTADFYKRRILRIFPALFAMLLITTAAALIVLPPYQLREFGQALFASSGFASNLLFWLKSGYFDAAAEANPLVHTWSLAVEEQFYIVAPLMALLIVRSRAGFYVALAVVGLASLAFSEVTNNVVPSTYFFFTINRIFELIVGCVIGCLFNAKQMGELKPWANSLSPVMVNIISAIAIGALFWCFFSFGPDSRHPGLITLVPVLATGALLAFHTSNSFVHRLLAQAPFVAIGVISYSLYLVHQPVLALARTMTFGTPSALLLSGLLLLSFLLAYLMWRLVEQPFRDYDRFTLRQTFGGGAALLVVGFAAGLVLFLSNGLPQRYAQSTIELTRPGAVPAADLLTDGLLEGQAVILWGDSHAKMLFPAMKAWTQETGGSAELITNGGCPPIVGFDNDWRNMQGPKCSTFNRRTLDSLIARNGGATIVLAARWPNYLRAPKALDEFGHPWTLASRSIFPAGQRTWQKDSTQDASLSLAKTIALLQQSGHRVIVVGTVPAQRVHADDLGFMMRGDVSQIEAMGVDRTLHDNAAAQAEAMLGAAVSKTEAASIVDPADILCTAGKCSYLYRGRMAYEDNNHLNDWGASPLAREILMQASALDKADAN